MAQRIVRANLSLLLAVWVAGASTAVCQSNLMPAKLDPNVGRALEANTDVLGREVLAQGEPSFDRVARYFPPMQRPREIVGVKEHPGAIGVEWDGALELGAPYNGKHGSVRISLRLGDPPAPYDIGGPVTRDLAEGYLPVVQTRWPFEGLLYDETVFGYSRGMSPDEPLSAYVRVQVTNPRGVESAARITLFSAPALGAPIPSFAAQIPANGHHEFYFKIPYHVDPRHLALPLASAEFKRALNETESFWMRFLNQHMQISTPEARVNDAYRAALMYNSLNVHKINGDYEIHDGSGFYEEVYGYSAALYCDALSRYGYWKEAKKYLNGMLKHQRPDGAYITVYGQPDNGALLFALARQYEFSHDLAWFKSVAPRMVRMCEWIRRNRQRTEVTENGIRPLTYGLLSAGKSYVDYPYPVYSYYSDAYNWLGLAAAAQTFGAAGMSAEAGRWSAEAKNYHQDILASMEKTVVDVGGFKVLPVEPMTHRLMKEGGGDYYALIAPLILETRFFRPGDVRTQWITRYMEQRGGLLLGLDRFGDGVDHAYTYGYALTQLRNGNINKFLLTFYSMLAYGMSRDTYSAVEVTHIAQGVNELTLPHTYSNTQMLRMLRAMLVRDEGDDLLLASGTPRAWLAPGQKVAVSRAPTRYGMLTFTISSNPKTRRIRAVLEPLASGTGRFPAHAKLWLQAAGPYGRMKKVMVNGKPWRAVRDEAIEIPGSMMSNPVDIVARY